MHAHSLTFLFCRQDTLQGLMCVEKDNSAVKGDFFEDQGYPSASQFFGPGGLGSKQLGFHSYKLEMNNFKANARYQLGDQIGAFHYLSDQQMKTAFGGFLVLPTADDGGNCIELNAVSFGKSETGSCSKRITDLAADCESILNAERYVSDIFGTSYVSSSFFSA